MSLYVLVENMRADSFFAGLSCRYPHVSDGRDSHTTAPRCVCKLYTAKLSVRFGFALVVRGVSTLPGAA